MDHILGWNVVSEIRPVHQDTRRSFIRHKPTALKAPCPDKAIRGVGRISGLPVARSEISGKAPAVTTETTPPPRHPADGCLQPDQLLPADLSPQAYCVALEELRSLYSTPLAAPRSFLRVESNRQATIVAAAKATDATTIASASPFAISFPGVHSYPYPPVVPPAQSPVTALAETAGDPAVQMTHEPTSLPPPRTLAPAATAAAVLSRGAVSCYLAATPVASSPLSQHMAPSSPPLPQLSTRRRRLPVMPVAAPVAVQPQAKGEAHSQPHARTHDHAQFRCQLDGGRDDLRSGADAGDGGGHEVAGSGGGSGEYCWDGDPTHLTTLPYELLGQLLLGCARRRVALRLSALQAYLDVVSYRSPELAAENLVSAMEGLASYSFRQRLPPAATAASAEAAPRRMGYRSWDRRLTTPHLSSASPASPASSTTPASSSSSLSGSSWADPILLSLLQPYDHAASHHNSQAVANTPGRADNGKDVVRAMLAVHYDANTTASSSALDGAASTSHRRGRAVPRAATLAPSRVVHLLRLLVQLDVRPPRSWLAAFLDCTTHLAVQLYGGELVDLMAALMALRAVPGSFWWGPILEAWEAPAAPVGEGTATDVQNIPALGYASGSASGPRAETSCTSANGPQGLGPQEVRCAILYYASRLGATRAATARALGTSRLARWAEAALYDTAQALLPCNSYFNDGVSQPTPPVSQRARPPPPPPLAVAMALSALSTVLPNAMQWASDPAGRGRDVLTMLVEALGPYLGELPPEMLLELLQGFTAGRLHPGPGFLRQHARALRRQSCRLSPVQLLQAAKHYRMLGVPPTGSLRTAVRKAWEDLRAQPLSRRQRQRQQQRQH